MNQTEITHSQLTSQVTTLEEMVNITCFCKLKEHCVDKNASECMRNRNIYQEFMVTKQPVLLLGAPMHQEKTTNERLDILASKLTEINHNMLKVFWIVALFAILYFGLMIYLLFFRTLGQPKLRNNKP